MRQGYREFARSLIPTFIEVAVECPLEQAMQRDYKGTYLRGQRGESSTAPGLQDPYEAPLNPDVRVDMMKVSVSEAVENVMRVLEGKFY